MDKKYEMTNMTKEMLDGTVVHRIRAIKDFATTCGLVRKDNLGGWIEHEDNLSQHGAAWVAGEAIVKDGARVYDSACVGGFAVVSDNARCSGRSLVYGTARVKGDAWVFCNATVSGGALIEGYAKVRGETRVHERAIITGSATVSGNAWVYENACVSGLSYISGSVDISGNAMIDGTVQIINSARISEAAHISSAKDIIVVGPIGSRNDTITVFKDSKDCVIVKTGCFTGTLDEFETAVCKEHGDSEFGKEYRALIALARIRFADVLNT